MGKCYKVFDTVSFPKLPSSLFVGLAIWLYIAHFFKFGGCLNTTIGGLGNAFNIYLSDVIVF
jgi:hypothetical protein